MNTKRIVREQKRSQALARSAARRSVNVGTTVLDYLMQMNGIERPSTRWHTNYRRAVEGGWR